MPRTPGAQRRPNDKILKSFERDGRDDSRRFTHVKNAMRDSYTPIIAALDALSR